MQDYKQLTVRQIRDGLSAKQFSARELADAAFAEIEAQDKDIHAFLELTPELAYTQADKIDAAVAAGEALGNLAGVPIAFKDNEVGNSFWKGVGWTFRDDLNYYDFILNEENITAFNK